jgi:hypothetical protein
MREYMITCTKMVQLLSTILMYVIELVDSAGFYTSHGGIPLRSPRSSPSWEIKSPADGQEIRRLLWNPKIYYRVHNNLPQNHILGQTNPYNHAVSLRCVLILSSHLRLGLSTSLFLISFPTKNHITSPIRVTSPPPPSYSPWFHHSSDGPKIKHILNIPWYKPRLLW